jgi:hypothetical protein
MNQTAAVAAEIPTGIACDSNSSQPAALLKALLCSACTRRPVPGGYSQIPQWSGIILIDADSRGGAGARNSQQWYTL